MPGMTELLIVLGIVIVVFGTKKLKGMGGDLGGAIKGFKSAMKDEKETSEDKAIEVTEKVDTKDKEEVQKETNNSEK